MLTALAATAAPSTEPSDTVNIPERAIVIVGNPNTPGSNRLISVLYSEEDLHFSDPRAPRFLFLDRNGKIALGIGGYLKGTMQYDMAGAIDDGSNFTTNAIPVPLNPELRNRFFANASSSTIFLKLVGKTTSLGDFVVYMQTEFNGGGPGGYGLKLKQAYASLGYVTAGLARSTFVDGPAGFPVIDDAGPSGANTGHNVLVQYSPKFSNGLSAAVSAEMPDADYTVNAGCKAISQRVPDIPVYLQYSWDKGSHVRASALLRNLSYRDLISGKNHFVTGWGVMLSGVAKTPVGVSAYWQATYGKGIARYVQDLSGTGFDLIPDATRPGEMKAPASLGVVAGLTYGYRKFSVGAAYSQCRLYDQRALGGDTYRDGRYVVANLFYNMIPDLSLGLEYLHGNRTDVNRATGHANRVMAMLKYSF